jgi:hypothetical protein
MSIKIKEDGKVYEGGWNFSIVAYDRGFVYIRTIDDNKWYYEKGYEKEVKRKLNKKNMTIKFENRTWDLSGVAGFDTI